ncbi:hypothetical protein E2562_022263 [Oryza meyeriana var. granulata]|uniref:Uncharacterized protein n=1 Tax=Oryza meyeriana var. granulata TaxID=110450 RepID=A0A6G1D683_9ORYZ|nr:hypothetical protein E2562_022263 [Oryza meyeriana var. granulata]
MGSIPVAPAESYSDLTCGLIEEGRPHPPVAAAPVAGRTPRRRNPTPPWLRAIRWFCILAAAAMVAVFAAEVFPRCKSKEDVLLCVLALAIALLTGPILGLALTMCVESDD